MTREEALKAWEQMYSEIDKDNWLFVGTINPQMVEWAIRALADHKTENSSEKPNNFDKDINVRSKDEPQIEPCDTCRFEDYSSSKEPCNSCLAGDSKWQPKDESQTDCPWK